MDELRCNSLRCRKALSVEGTAVVTTCSHIFCVDCANALISMPQICPACETVLPDNEDVVQMFFNPHDSYKTSVLSGLSPTTILDIATRALNFNTYQVQQESAFQALITKNAQERIAVLEAQCNTITREAHAEIGLLKDRVTNAERDLEFERRRVHELQETHKANAKAYSKLKAQYDKAKQRALLQPGDATSFPAALQSGHVGGTPAHTPRGGSSARQQFVPSGAQPAQQFRPASVLGQSAAAHGGWTPPQAHGLQGAVPFAQASVLHSQNQHQQHQAPSRARRSLLPEQQHVRAPVNAVGAGGPLRNSTGLGARRRSAGSSGSGGSCGQQRGGGGGFAGAQGGGMSGFLGQATTGGARAAPLGGGRGGFRPAQPHSRQSG